MMKMTTTLSALTIAAALMMSLTACTNDDNIADGTEQPTTVHVTVSAGIGGDGDGTTRAAVVQEGTTRTLTFTACDRLYITAAALDLKFLAGYVTIDATSISSDGTSASFSGDLKLWDTYGNDVTSSITFGADPFDEFNVAHINAYLVPKDAPEGLLVFNEYHTVSNFDYTKSIAADVNTLMKSAIYVRGFCAPSETFSLSGETAILNCPIGKLTANEEYSVTLRWASNQSDYESNHWVEEITYDGTVTADGNGTARFAIGNKALENYFYVLRLQRGSTTKDYVLGQKTLFAKVYNVTKDYYTTCNLTVQMPLVPGANVYEQCNTITVKRGENVLYETPSGTKLTFINGRTSFSFQMQPVTDATLTITGTNTSTSETFVGTVEHVTLVDNGTCTIGPVSLVKQ